MRSAGPQHHQVVLVCSPAVSPTGPVEHGIPDSLLARIGDVTVSFESLDMQVQLLAWLLLGDLEKQRIGRIITAELRFAARCDLVLNLYREQFDVPERFKELQALVGRARELEQQRNRITHSFWMLNQSAGEGGVRRIKVTAKGKRGLAWDEEVVNEDNLTAVAEALRQLAGEIMNFQVELSITDR